MLRLWSIALAAFAAIVATTPVMADPLPSWREGPNKQSILDFVTDVTTEGRPGFVPPAERIAVFDNDGTLWSEQPGYFQFFFVLDRVRALAPQNPDWATRQPFKAAIEGDMKALAETGEHGLMELVMATHAAMTPEAFQAIVAGWLETARHPRFKDRRFDSLVFQPMLELLGHLRASGFKTFIVSGGGVEFMRVFAERAYGVPPEQVIGSSIKTGFELRDGKATLVRKPELNFFDDKAGKPIAINQHIGRRPTIAVGNSDGDFEMLQWSTEGPGRRLGIIVRHDDATREYAYDRDSSIGRLARALDEAPSRGWVVVSMQNDWKTIYIDR